MIIIYLAIYHLVIEIVIIPCRADCFFNLIKQPQMKEEIMKILDEDCYEVSSTTFNETSNRILALFDIEKVISEYLEHVRRFSFDSVTDEEKMNRFLKSKL